MLSAMYAARNILGENHDVWNVNVERSYHEEFELSKKEKMTEAKAGRAKARAAVAPAGRPKVPTRLDPAERAA